MAAFPQTCLRNDNTSTLKQWSLPMVEALLCESEIGRRSLGNDAINGASRFRTGGRAVETLRPSKGEAGIRGMHAGQRLIFPRA